MWCIAFGSNVYSRLPCVKTYVSTQKLCGMDRVCESVPQTYHRQPHHWAVHLAQAPVELEACLSVVQLLDVTCR